MTEKLQEMVSTALLFECREGHSWATEIVKTLMQIAVTPDEFTEDAAVNAARLIWEILSYGEVHGKDG